MEKKTQTKSRSLCEDAAEMRVMQPQAKECWGHRRLEEAGKDPPLEPLEKAQPCWHPDLRFLASRSVTEYISVV